MGSKGVGLGGLLHQPVSRFHVNAKQSHLSPLRIRFVDRNMFMRYRGGGFGHKYMQDIEAKHENMSRERLHGKKPRDKPRPQADNSVSDVSDSDDDSQDGEGSSSSSKGEGSDSSDEDSAPSETGLSDDTGADSDSDEITSDLDYDSYGLADP